MIIEEAKALGASVLFFPEGRAVAAGGVCGSGAIPDPNDPGWVDFKSVEKWEGSRSDVKDYKVKDSTIGRVVLLDELELAGDIQYAFTVNVLVAFIIGIFFRVSAPLTAASYQFNPDTGVSPRGWLMMDNRDQAGTLILAANLWGKLKYTGKLTGGAGEIIKPEVTFMQFKNALNTMALGTP